MLLHHILYEYCRGHCKWRRSGGISTLSRWDAEWSGGESQSATYHCQDLHSRPSWFVDDKNRPWSETCKKWGIIITCVIAIWTVCQQPEKDVKEDIFPGGRDSQNLFGHADSTWWCSGQDCQPSEEVPCGWDSKIISKVWYEMRRMTYKEDGKERSVFDDTVIIFTSTNGALTPEVGISNSTWSNLMQSPGAGGGSNKPLRGSLGDLLEGATRIPAFVSNLDKVATFKVKGDEKWILLLPRHPEQSRASSIYLTGCQPLSRGWREVRWEEIFNLDFTIVENHLHHQARSSDDLDGVNQVNVLKRVSMPLRTEVISCPSCLMTS